MHNNQIPGKIYPRIIVIGATGSGKTTFARNYAARLCIPFADMDDIYWLPGWQKRDEQDFRALAAQAAEQPQWAMSGNYSAARDKVWTQAAAIVWLDFPFYLVFWRLLKRSILRIWDRKQVCNGNTESLRNLFSGQSIIIWLFKTHGRHRKNYAAIFADAGLYPQADYIRLQSPAAAAAWLDKISAAKQAAV
ncbi:MAG: hypothetical protein RBS08_06760 [Bdellovibrionales bacterium]|nr:hypothetical protein [Bdellovibrionales bacterium]